MHNNVVFDELLKETGHAVSKYCIVNYLGDHLRKVN